MVINHRVGTLPLRTLDTGTITGGPITRGTDPAVHDKPHDAVDAVTTVGTANPLHSIPTNQPLVHTMVVTLEGVTR